MIKQRNMNRKSTKSCDTPKNNNTGEEKRNIKESDETIRKTMARHNENCEIIRKLQLTGEETHRHAYCFFQNA